LLVEITLTGLTNEQLREISRRFTDLNSPRKMKIKIKRNKTDKFLKRDSF